MIKKVIYVLPFDDEKKSVYYFNQIRVIPSKSAPQIQELFSTMRYKESQIIGQEIKSDYIIQHYEIGINFNNYTAQLIYIKHCISNNRSNLMIELEREEIKALVTALKSIGLDNLTSGAHVHPRITRNLELFIEKYLD